jgi:hypothetical protein
MAKHKEEAAHPATYPRRRHTHVEEEEEIPVAEEVENGLKEKVPGFIVPPPQIAPLAATTFLPGTTSGSGAPVPIFRIGLWSNNGKTLIANVNVPSPLPPLILYQGNYYVYSSWIYSRYVQQTPFAAIADLGAPILSVVAFPEF